METDNKMRAYRFAKVMGNGKVDIVYVMIFPRYPTGKRFAQVIDSFGILGDMRIMGIERSRKYAADIIKACRRGGYLFLRID